MGQKINPHILRLGINNKEWNSKYLEKNIEEATLYSYKDIQIQQYITRFFYLIGLTIHTCNIRYSNNHLNLNISYYCTKKFVSLLQQLLFINKYKILLKNNSFNPLFIKTLIKQPKKRLSIIKKFKKLLLVKNFKNNQIINLNKFSNKFITSLSLYFNKKLNINLIMDNLNKGLSLRLLNDEAKLFRSLVLRLRKFSNSIFFKEAISVILITIRKKNSARFLCTYIANELSYIKRHNYFLNFLKSSLILFINSKLSKITGIKIIISGRFNGAPRSKKKLILIGNVPVQKLKVNIDYHETTSFTSNGTFGVKVWIAHKNN